MKRIQNIWFLLSILILTTLSSCVDSGDVKEEFVDQRVDNYPRRIESLVCDELELKFQEQVKILTIDVFHPLVHQIEPTERSFIDKKEYRVFVKVKMDGKKAFFCLSISSKFNILEIREEKSWPRGIPESRRPPI